MIAFKTTEHFRHCLDELKSYKKGVYSSIELEINDSFLSKTSEELKSNNDMILIENDFIVIKLRMPDRRNHKSKRDGYRILYLAFKTRDEVVFIDVFPKRGPLQRISVSDQELDCLLCAYYEEAKNNLLQSYP